MKRKFFASTINPGTGDAAYSVFHNINGSGSILADDFSAVLQRFFDRLPDAQPSPAFVRRRIAVAGLRDLVE